MATISVSYPVEYTDVILAGLRAYLGEDADDISDSDAAKKALARFAMERAQVTARAAAKASAVADRDAKIEVYNSAAAELEAAQQAVKAAEVASDQAVARAFGEV